MFVYLRDLCNNKTLVLILGYFFTFTRTAHAPRTMSDDGMLHLSNAPNQSALWSPANVLKAVYGFVLFTLLIVIAHGQSQTANERNHWHCRDGLGYRDMGDAKTTPP